MFGATSYSVCVSVFLSTNSPTYSCLFFLVDLLQNEGAHSQFETTVVQFS